MAGAPKSGSPQRKRHRLPTGSRKKDSASGHSSSSSSSLQAQVLRETIMYTRLKGKCTEINLAHTLWQTAEVSMSPALPFSSQGSSPHSLPALQTINTGKRMNMDVNEENKSVCFAFMCGFASHWPCPYRPCFWQLLTKNVPSGTLFSKQETVGQINSSFYVKF